MSHPQIKKMGSDEKLVSPTPTGIHTLAEQLHKFNNLQNSNFSLAFKLDFKLSPMELANSILHNNGQWHKYCYSDYASDFKLAQFKRKIESLSGVEQSGVRYSTRSHAEAIGELVCVFCQKRDTSDNLHRAGEKYQKSNKNSEYIKKTTDEWIELASFANDYVLLAKLATGDLRSSEIFYHLSCYSDLKRRADRQSYLGETAGPLGEVAMSSDLVSYHKNTCIYEVIKYAEKELRKSPESQIPLACLLEVNEELLASRGIQPESKNITRFREKISSVLPKNLQLLKRWKTFYVINTNEQSANGIGEEGASEFLKRAKIVSQVVRAMDSVPDSLIKVLALIIEGRESAATESVISCAQLSMFNLQGRFRAEEYKEGGYRKRNLAKETPLPMYVGLKLYLKFRCKATINQFHEMGISASYMRVRTIGINLGNSAVVRYRTLGMVFPNVLRIGIFTTGAVDNLDQNSTSNTAEGSYHGTAITVTQHPTLENPGTEQEPLGYYTDSNTVLPLLASYTTVLPTTIRKNVPVGPMIGFPSVGDAISSNSHIEEELEEEFKWAQCVREHIGDSDEDDYTALQWEAYHANCFRSTPRPKVINSVLPLFHENANSMSMIKHSFDQLIKVTQKANPGQATVIALDQPLFALGKQLQWAMPETYGEKKVVLQFGGLHYEKNIQQVLGRWLESSEWQDMLHEAGIITGSGLEKSLSEASHIKKCRYVHQCLASVLFILLQTAFEDENDEDDDYETWLNLRLNRSDDFFYWHKTLQLELKYFLFVRSLRESDFRLYKETVKDWCPWFFSLNHTNYARWTPVHSLDMDNLQETAPDIHHEYEVNGHFTVSVTGRNFSTIALDQNHEQQNCKLKGEGQIVGKTQDPVQLQSLLVCTPEISRLVDEYEAKNETIYNRLFHHSSDPASQKRFIKFVKLLLAVMLKAGSPFVECHPDLTSLKTKRKAQEGSGQYARAAEEKGKTLYKHFVHGVLITREKSIWDPIPRHEVLLFKEKGTTRQQTLKESLKTSRKGARAAAELLVLAQQRVESLDSYFSNEHRLPPSSLTSQNRAASTSKADLLTVLEEKVPDGDLLDVNTKDVTCIVIDGPAMVQMLQPDLSVTFTTLAP